MPPHRASCLAPAQHGGSLVDRAGTEFLLFQTRELDSRKGSGLFLFPLPFILCFKLYDFIIENNTC